MSSRKWTESQLKAIEARGCNLLVSAAAGAGKTAVLVERVIRRITENEGNTDIDKLLIVTFTRAAASEMRERIGSALLKLIEEHPDNATYRRQLTLLSNASITTIHSFCLEVIRNGFNYLNIDPGFRMADEVETQLLKLETLDELIEDIYDEPQIMPLFPDMLECWSGSRDDSGLKRIILDLYDFVRSVPWPDKWLNEKLSDYKSTYDGNFALTSWGREIISYVSIMLGNSLSELKRMYEMTMNCEGLEGYNALLWDETLDLQNLISRFNLESDEPDIKWDRLVDTMQSFSFGRLPRAGKNCDRELAERVKNTRNEVKKIIEKLKNNFFYSCTKDIEEDNKIMYPCLKGLTEMVIEFDRRFSDKKIKRSILDFNDLEHLCLKLLTSDEKIAQRYRSKFDEILVDEYQDINPVQDLILRTVSRENSSCPNLFMVGDVKQSIYRFRQAKPELFLEKYLKYPEAEGGPSMKITLPMNFRSRKSVLDSANFIFSKIMNKVIGELEYGKKESLVPGALYADDESSENNRNRWSVEVHIIDTEAKNPLKIENISTGDETEDEKPDVIRAEAKFVSSKISELLKYEVFDKETGETRKARFRDITVLLRTTRRWADFFMEEFAISGIPAISDSGSGFFNTTEIQTIISLLQIIDNPRQDIPLLSVMRSPIGNFTSEDLANLRLQLMEGSIYEALEYVYAKQVGGELNSRLGLKSLELMNKLKEWRKQSVYMSTGELLHSLLEETAYFEIAGAMPGGKQRQANLMQLLEKAYEYEKTSFKGLFNFINYIHKIKESSQDAGNANLFGEEENAVRIMSIHKSKGLEFPIVILAGCGTKFNLQDTSKKLLLHQELGFGPNVVDTRRRITYPSMQNMAIKWKIKQETLSEEMRILYVAMTRAREKLIITSSVRDISAKMEKWRMATNENGDVNIYSIMSAFGFIDWIGLAIAHGSSGIKVVFHHLNSIINQEVQCEVSADNITDLEINQDSNCGGAFVTKISEILDWKYRYKGLIEIPSKVTVTELKNRFNTLISDDAPSNISHSTAKAVVRKPAFLSATPGEITGAETGSILHFVMQHLNFCDNDIKGQIDSFVRKNLLTEKQADSVNINKIISFFKSDIGRRLKASKEVYREVPFNMEIPCSEISDDESLRDINETLLLQGIIDCYFVEDGKFVLIDYKSDKYQIDDASIIKKYSFQIKCYRRALEKLAGIPVKECCIYLFENGRTVVIQ